MTLPAAAPVRVLMVVRLFHPWVGGTERQAYKLARTLLEQGTEVQVLTGWWTRGTKQHEIIDGVPVFRHHTLWEFFGVRGLRKFGGYLYILTLLWHLWRRRRSYDVIHVHGLNYHTFAAVVAARRLRKPVIAKLANSGPGSDIAKMREDRQLALARFMLPVALQCDRFVALNPRVVDELRSAGVSASRIVEIPNGVEAGAPPSEYTLHRPPVVLYVGRLHKQKGLETLLGAMAAVRRGNHAAVLRLVGDGPERQSLEALAARLDLASCVEFLGTQDDVARHLQGADVFVLPSYAEGISNALLEAMAWGLPPVVSDIPGNRDVVVHGRTGWVTPPGDAEALTEAIRRLLTDHALRRTLGCAASSAVQREYGLRSVADRYRELYSVLCGGETLPAPVNAPQRGSHDAD